MYNVAKDTLSPPYLHFCSIKTIINTRTTRGRYIYIDMNLNWDLLSFSLCFSHLFLPCSPYLPYPNRTLLILSHMTWIVEAKQLWNIVHVLLTLGFHRAQGMMSSMQRLWRNLGRPRKTNLSIKYIYPASTTIAFMHSWPGLHFFMHEQVSVIC